MTRQNYLLLLRVLSVVVAATLWLISITFSVDGFNFQVADMAWAGWFMGIAITAIELIWNKQGANSNMTILLIGVFAYLYGVITNVMGVLTAQNVVDIGANPMGAVFAGIVGFFLEIAPEPLFVWGLVGVSDMGDVISTLMGKPAGGHVQQRQTSMRPQGQHPNNGRVHQNSNRQ